MLLTGRLKDGAQDFRRPNNTFAEYMSKIVMGILPFHCRFGRSK